MRPVLALVFTFLAFAVLKTWPLTLHFGTRLPSDLGDPLLNTWILAWDVHALTTDPGHLFDANISYPIGNALAFSEHLLGVLPLFAPVYLLTGNPVAGANTVFVLSFALSAFTVFCLCWYWTRSFWPSVVAGALLGFAPPRFGQISHLQLLNFFWAPLALLFLDRFLRFPRWLPLTAFAVFYWLQVLSSVYLAFMLTAAVVVYVAVHAMMSGRRLWERPLLVHGAAFVGASLAVLLPVELPYLAAHRAWEAAWTARAMAGSSADPLRYLAVSPLVNDVYQRLFAFAAAHAGHETRLFPGLVLAALVVLGFTTSVAGLPREHVRRLRVLFGALLATAVVLSLGPYLVLGGTRTPIPLPYLLLYHLVPGWSGMRVPARFVFLGLLAAAPLAALGMLKVGEIARQWSPRAPALAAVGVLAVFLLELGAQPLPTVAVPTGATVPPVYRWLARARPGPIVELPFESSFDQRYLYLSAFHWLPLVNGQSGFVPPPHEELIARLASLPDAEAIAYAAALGVRAIVVHADRLDVERRERFTLAEQAARLRRLADFGADVAYEVRPATAGTTLHARFSVPGRIPAGRETRVGLLLTSGDGRPWIHPRPPGLSRALVEWRDPASKASVRGQATVQLPLVVLPGEVVAVAVRVRAPTSAGRYVLSVAIPSRDLRLESSPIGVDLQPVPTSADAPTRLAAAYHTKLGDRRARRGETLAVDVSATNVGEALWLSKAANNRGEVALRWRWLGAAGQPAGEDGSARVRFEVFPGQTHPFHLALEPPLPPGRYRLRIDLVSRGVADFAAAGTPPLELTVDVLE